MYTDFPVLGKLAGSTSNMRLIIINQLISHAKRMLYVQMRFTATCFGSRLPSSGSNT
jgi:hypothetical protein